MYPVIVRLVHSIRSLFRFPANFGIQSLRIEFLPSMHVLFETLPVFIEDPNLVGRYEWLVKVLQLIVKRMRNSAKIRTAENERADEVDRFVKRLVGLPQLAQLDR